MRPLLLLPVSQRLVVLGAAAVGVGLWPCGHRGITPVGPRAAVVVVVAVALLDFRVGPGTLGAFAPLAVAPAPLHQPEDEPKAAGGTECFPYGVSGANWLAILFLAVALWF